MRKKMCTALLPLALISSPATAGAEPAAKVPTTQTSQCDAGYCVELVDFSPRFLDFYSQAAGLDGDARFTLWQARYGFAAVPPGPRGAEMARTLLDGAWSRYPQALGVIRAGAGAMQPQPAATLKAVASLLGLGEPYQVKVLAYVGGFEDNAFSAVQDGKPFVAIPLEMSVYRREMILAHEMTHAVHLGTAKLRGGWERSIAETIFQEGLAMHVARAVVPGRDVRDYVEHKPGWWDAVGQRKADILRDMLPVLEKSDSDTVFRFTIGAGPSGLEREAYVAGWYVVEQLRAQGMSLAEIAHIPEAQMAETVRQAIGKMLPPG